MHWTAAYTGRPQIHAVNGAHANAAHLAAASGGTDVLMALLNAATAANGAAGRAALLGARDANKWSAVHHAAAAGRTDALRLLLQAGATANLRDRWSRLPLAWAAFGGHAGAVLALVAAGAHLREGGEGGRSQPQRSRQRRLNNRWSPALHLAVQVSAADRLLSKHIFLRSIASCLVLACSPSPNCS